MAVAFVISILGLIFIDSYDHDVLYGVLIGIALISGVILFCMIGVIICENAFADRMLAKLQAEREALVYQMEHNLFLGDALGEFNKKIVSWKMTYESPWTSWFQGDYILQIDPISLK
jgi:hypothetical protein